MSKIEFIHLLVSSKFASQYEAEQYTYACGTSEWCYLNPFNKTHANSENETISYYTFDLATQTHQKKTAACLTSS